jgi:hypothetical protein
MKQEQSTIDQTELMLNLAQMVLEVDVRKQCGNLARLVKNHFPAQGIGFLLKRPGFSQAYFHKEEMPADILEAFEGIIPELDLKQAVSDEFMGFSLDKGKLTMFDPEGDHPVSEPIVLTSQLRARDTVLGSLALVADLETDQNLTGEKAPLPWLTNIISSLLYNAISQEENVEKIRFLRLYQTVSSALGYVGELQELLTTIISIVTAELPSEEVSILLHDEETNEFEFFTAVGETGAELVKLRFPADKGIAGRALRERSTILVNDVQSSPDFYGSIDEDHDF